MMINFVETLGTTAELAGIDRPLRRASSGDPHLFH
jgi:hypothetical protein